MARVYSRVLPTVEHCAGILDDKHVAAMAKWLAVELAGPQVGDYSMSVWAKVITALETKGDIGRLSPDMVSNLINQVCGVTHFDQPTMSDPPVKFIAEALLATNPATWTPEQRETMYSRLKQAWEGKKEQDKAQGGSGFITSVFTGNFGELALACKPPESEAA